MNAKELREYLKPLLQQQVVEWNLSVIAFSKALKLAVEDNIGKKKDNVDTSKLRLFLYAKGFYASLSSNEREVKFNSLLNQKTTRKMVALERLKTIVIKGESTRTELKPAFLFDAFVDAHPEWNEPDAFVIFRDHPNLKGIIVSRVGKRHALVERIQKEGLCYMNAPIVMQHYLVAMNNDAEVPMLDMIEYLKKHMPSKSLRKHIIRDQGESSMDFFKKILHDTAGRQKGLQSYGPGLVSGFKVPEEFKGNSYQHLGPCEVDDSNGLHAMVLVGSRLHKDEKDEKRRYLLQNWWASKPYVEVDSEYLFSSEALVRFIKKNQTKMGDYPTNSHEMVECELGIDACECFMPES